MLVQNAQVLSTALRRDLLNGVQVITDRAVALTYDASGQVTRTERDFTAIPYYA